MSWKKSLILICIDTSNFGLRSSSAVLALTAMAVVLSIGISYCLSSNAYLIGQLKDEMPQYEFEKIMHSENDNPTLLNHNFLDGGFHYVVGIMPINRFSCKIYIGLPEQMEEQALEINFVLKNGKVIIHTQTTLIIICLKGYWKERWQIEKLCVDHSCFESSGCIG